MFEAGSWTFETGSWTFETGWDELKAISKGGALVIETSTGVEVSWKRVDGFLMSFVT